MDNIQLVPLRTIDQRLTEFDDRKLLLALNQLGFEALVTLNYKMLRNPVELAAVLKTKLTVFAIEGLGDDPIRATGALLLDLQPAVNAMRSGRTGVFWLRPRAPKPQEPWKLFEQAAQKNRQDPQTLYNKVKVSNGEVETVASLFS